MARKHEFASAGWFEELRAEIERAVAAAGKDFERVRWSVCEVFTDVPSHLARTPDGKTGWHCRVRGREIAFGLGEIDDADLKITADYATALPLARVRLGDDPAAQAKVNETLMSSIAAGKMRIEGDFGARPPELAGLHDEMVDVTE